MESSQNWNIHTNLCKNCGISRMGPNNTTLPAAYYNYYYSDTGETTKRSSVNINLEWAIVDGLRAVAQFSNHNRHSRSHFFVKNNPCLLYTSDAADD